MKRHIVTLFLSCSLSISLLLNGCGDTAAQNPDQYADEKTAPSSLSLGNENTETIMSPTLAGGQEPDDNLTNADQNAICSLPLSREFTTVEQGGPYGKLSLSIPADWCYKTCPMDSENLLHGLYGICFYPDGITDGYIELSYIDSFGVCGTGLTKKTEAIAGNTVNVGTYDNHAYWDFITFGDDYTGIVALTYNVDSWWDNYDTQVMDILGTLSYDASAKEGGAYIYNAVSEADKIGLSLTLKNISPTGATLVFHQYDETAPTGELEYGSDFVLEIQKNNVWEEVPTIPDNYAFNAAAYLIPKQDSTKQELDWEWLYGTLAPGVYRIKKEITDFRGSGDYDIHTVYAQFLLN